MRHDIKITSTFCSFFILAAFGAGCDEASIGRGSDAGEAEGDTDADFDDTMSPDDGLDDGLGDGLGDGLDDGLGDETGGGDAGGDPGPGGDGEPTPEDPEDPEDAEAPACTLDDALGELPGDASWTELACEDQPNGDVVCVSDVHIGAGGGIDGDLRLHVTGEGLHLRLAFDVNPDMHVFEAFLVADDAYEFTTRLDDPYTLAQALELDPTGPEVAEATIDIVKLLKGVGPTVPQPQATWCERACTLSNYAVCGGISGAAAGCCVATAGVCCAPGAAAAAITCLNTQDCEKVCDSSNL